MLGARYAQGREATQARYKMPPLACDQAATYVHSLRQEGRAIAMGDGVGCVPGRAKNKCG